MKLEDYQIEAIKFLKARRTGILEMGCRTGKSLTSLMASEGPTLVICHPSLVETWREEILLYKLFSNKRKRIDIVKSLLSMFL